MAKQGNPIDVPDFNGDWGKYRDWFDEQLKAHTKPVKSTDADLTGALLQWQRADGYAYYVVTKNKPLTISHLPLGDAWTVEAALIRGLTEADVREQLRRREAWEALAAKNKPHAAP